MDLEVTAASEPAAVPRCANCRITLRGERVLAGEREYCCDGCVAGGPCCC